MGIIGTCDSCHSAISDDWGMTASSNDRCISYCMDCMLKDPARVQRELDGLLKDTRGPED